MEWFARLIGHCDANAVDFFLFIVNIVGAKEEIVFPIALGYSRRLYRPVRPRDVVRVQNPAVFGPMNQIRRRKSVEEHLLVVLRGIGGIDPILIAENCGLRVGVPAFENRIARARRCFSGKGTGFVRLNLRRSACSQLSQRAYRDNRDKRTSDY